MIVECAEFIEQYKAKLTVNMALAIIHSYEIPPTSVSFEPIFSFAPDNTIISHCSYDNHSLYLHVNVSKISIFYRLNDYYFYLLHNDGEALSHVLSDGISSLLHHYFYGVHFRFNDSSHLTFLDDLMAPEQITVSQLQSLLQSKYSNLGIVLNVVRSEVSTSALANHLDKDTRLGCCYLHGERIHTCNTLEILVYLETYSQSLVDTAAKEIKSHRAVQALNATIPISVQFKMLDGERSSSLASTEMLTLSPEFEIKV
ncbi:hypothetical protein M9194_06240 [Vibrio sp. S4M6]|uniref:type VI secretion system baseplate protein IglJ n=1 Tax=Vibrio sinus TaxID=2946865 RepID=UPI00202A10CA|nr:type VI secretion system baseplate protein IglJ [Vibrio sinus]MCL9781023.1 hypothetical protein [Vibrio sinus]